MGRYLARRLLQFIPVVIGTMFLLPIILINMGWSYWVFRGKVQADIGYH